MISEQQTLPNRTRSSAQTRLTQARSIYDPPTPYAKQEDRFRSAQPLWEATGDGGLIGAQIPVGLGGQVGLLVDSAIVVEEMYAFETSMCPMILATALGLTSLVMAGASEQHSKFLTPFLTEKGIPLVSLVFSDTTGARPTQIMEAQVLEQGWKKRSTSFLEQRSRLPTIQHGTIAAPSCNVCFVGLRKAQITCVARSLTIS